MPSQFSALGFSIASGEDLAALASTVSDRSDTIDAAADGQYLKWAPPSGEQLWLQVRRNGDAMGMNLHFAGKSVVRIGLEARVAHHTHTPLDGTAARRQPAASPLVPLPDRPRLSGFKIGVVSGFRRTPHSPAKAGRYVLHRHRNGSRRRRSLRSGRPSGPHRAERVGRLRLTRLNETHAVHLRAVGMLRMRVGRHVVRLIGVVDEGDRGARRHGDTLRAGTAACAAQQCDACSHGDGTGPCDEVHGGVPSSASARDGRGLRRRHSPCCARSRRCCCRDWPE